MKQISIREYFEIVGAKLNHNMTNKQAVKKYEKEWDYVANNNFVTVTITNKGFLKGGVTC